MAVVVVVSNVADEEAPEPIVGNRKDSTGQEGKEIEDKSVPWF